MVVVAVVVVVYVVVVVVAVVVVVVYVVVVVVAAVVVVAVRCCCWWLFLLCFMIALIYIDRLLHAQWRSQNTCVIGSQGTTDAPGEFSALTTQDRLQKLAAAPPLHHMPQSSHEASGFGDSNRFPDEFAPVR